MTWPEFLAAKYTEKTAAAYAFEVAHFLKKLGEERALTANFADLVNYLAGLRKRYDKPATLRRILCAIKAYYRWLLETNQRADQPAAGLKLRDGARSRVQGQDLMSRAELAKLLAPRTERYGKLTGRNAVVIGLLVHQALTVREISLLEVGDIDLVAGTIKVAATNQTAGRVLELAVPQVMQLHAYLTVQRPELAKTTIDRLILTGRGGQENGDGVRYLVETLRPLVPGKKLTPTTIRQSVIALKLKNGEGLRQVQTFAGHKWVSTTEGYRETNLEELRAEVAKYHSLGGNL